MVPKKKARKAKAAETAREIVPAVTMKPYQQDALNAFDAGKRYQFNVWHRRAGKDWFSMFLGARQARTEVGSYWHLLPKHVQGRRAIWNGIDHQTGKRFLELFFPDAVAVNNTEMFIELECGSTWQLLGSDNYDRMVGSNPRGVVFSEWALCDPLAWDYIRPILRANHGWAQFITTFRGRNHAWQMFQTVKNDPEWHTSLLTIDDTHVITPEQVEADRRSGMSERLIRQEYYCEPAPPVSLGPYSRVLDGLDSAGAVRALPSTATDGAETYYAVASLDDYKVLVECVKRGQSVHVFGGRAGRNVALHELLGDRITRIAQRGASLIVSDDADVREAAVGLSLPHKVCQPAPVAKTATLLEHATVDPSSVAYAALSNSMSTKIDEEADPDHAARVAILALDLLAAGARTNAWGAPPDYRGQDRAIIGRRA